MFTKLTVQIQENYRAVRKIREVSRAMLVAMLLKELPISCLTLFVPVFIVNRLPNFCDPFFL